MMKYKLVFSGLVQGSTVVLDGKPAKVEDGEFDSIKAAADHADDVLTARDTMGDEVSGGAGIFFASRLVCSRTTPDGVNGWQFPGLDSLSW